jgi:hypothetical protein
MNRLLLVLGLFMPLAALGQTLDLGDHRLALIDDPLRVDFKGAPSGLTKERIRQSIPLLAAIKDWKLVSESEGRVELTRTVSNKHRMNVEVTYDQNGYSIRYLDSVNLLYTDGGQETRGRGLRAVHKMYNVWVRELSTAINNGLGISASAYVAALPDNPTLAAAPSMAPSAKASSAKPADEGLPSVGAKWKYSFRDQHLKTREQRFTVRVTGVDGWDVSESFLGPSGTPVASVLNAKELRFGARENLQGYFVVELAPYLYSSGLGQQAALQPPVRYPSTKTWKVSVPALIEGETTQVPAGAFQTLRVEVTGTAEAFGLASTDYAQPARFQYTAWYAPKVKRYVMTRHQTWSRVGTKVGDEIVMLLEYSSD